MAMRSVGSSVAKGMLGQLSSSMKSLWVEEVKKKPFAAFVVLTGAIAYGGVGGLSKVREQVMKEREEALIMKKRCEEKKRAYDARKDNIVLMLATEACLGESCK